MAIAAPLLFGGCGESPAEQAVRRLTKDPDARFQSVRSAGGVVCGEVNGPGRGAGYQRFLYDERAGTASVDPGEAAPGGSSDAEGCKLAFAYQSVEQRLSCAAAPQREAARIAKRNFEAAWRRACG